MPEDSGWIQPDFVSTTAPFPTPTAVAAAAGRIAVSVPAKEDGSPDWEHASEKVKAKFRKLVEDKETQELFLQEPAELDPVTAKMMGQWAIGIIFNVHGFVAAAKYNLTSEEIKEIFRPDFSAYPNFDEALVKVMQKRGPDFLKRWGSEITVGCSIILASVACWHKAAERAKEKGREEKRQAPGNGEAKQAKPATSSDIPVYAT
jgi:hypothetical protein